MPFSTIYGHEAVKELLLKTIRTERVPSAYLFTGRDGVGKSLLAKTFAQLLNCEKQIICHECSSCLMFDQESHPDFITVKAKTNFIKIQQIHDLIEKLSLKPSYAKKRVVLVKNAHFFNRESANAFLKTLEEPPLDTLLILTTTDEELLIETILSRCQKVSISPLKSEHLESVLLQSYEIPSDKMEFILNFSNGAIRENLIHKVDELSDIREQTIHILGNLNTSSMVDHSNVIEQIVNKSHHLFFIEFASSWVHDLLFLKQKSEEFLWNSDMLEILKKQEPLFSEEQLQWMFGLIQETEKAIKLFAGKILALEGLLIQLKQVAQGKIVV
ncbi:MAG: DNA polymerase-3 subunit delta' [bacterium]|jgi:DNA polymerase-3 subunit delta'